MKANLYYPYDMKKCSLPSVRVDIYEVCGLSSVPVKYNLHSSEGRKDSIGCLMKDRTASIIYLALRQEIPSFSINDAYHFSRQFIHGLPLMTQDMIPKGVSRSEIRANWMDEIFPFYRFEPEFVKDLESCINGEKIIEVKMSIPDGFF